MASGNGVGRFRLLKGSLCVAPSMMKQMQFAWPPATEIVVVGKFLFVLRSAGGADAARPDRKISSVTWRPLRGSSVTR
jgi:hypothetical protein